ncbi:MAG TPA: sensor histidine kinase [Candidatus Dormibacteraeota bacterium]|nr:sensor histidine kinase [Candidatus Dormibacteraeota bacterium]
MNLSRRLGQGLAIAWLLLLYPAVSIVFHGPASPVRVIGTLVALAAFIAVYLAFWLHWYSCPTPRSVSAITGLLLVLGLVINAASGIWTINPFIFPIMVAGYGYPVRLAVAAVVGLSAFAMAVVQPALGALKLSVTDLVAVELIYLLQLILIGFAAIGIGRLVATIAELRIAREQLALLAVEQERARFARDIHDLVGHSLSVITLKGELAAQLVDKAPGRAADEIRDIVRVARTALGEVREAVSGYRQPTLAAELAGARAAFAAAGIELRIEQAAGALTPEKEAVLAWTVREGATNVLRHSKAQRCTVQLSRDDDQIQLEIVDDGVGSALPQLGNGLRGLGERVREQDGRLEAGPLPNQGFRLRVSLPSGRVTHPAFEPSTPADVGQ